MKGIKEERIMVLGLLQEGKITVEEATKLLESLSITSGMDAYACESHDVEEKINKFTKSVEHFAKDAGSKISCAYRTCEPKVKSGLKTALEKTASALNRASESLARSLENNDVEVVIEEDNNHNEEQ
ncbi:MAG: hypothetical protein FWD82_06580 [Defluviitaleaceae bacterium]|nr:hypothetical protein [Defluviitaleaceae bacterium]